MLRFRLLWLPLLVMLGCGESAPQVALPYTSPCDFVLNQVRSNLDVDVSCEALPQKVLCGTRALKGFARAKKFAYRPDGRIVRQWSVDGIPGHNPRETFVDYVGAQVVETFADNGRRRFSYDDAGRLQTLYRPRFDEERRFTYDELDRLVGIDQTFGGKFGGSHEFTWRPDGGLLSIAGLRDLGLGEDLFTLQTFEVDSQGRLTRHQIVFIPEVLPNRDIRYEYEGNDRVRAGDDEYAYDTAPQDFAVAVGPGSYGLSGGQNEFFIRTGSPGRPWRVFLGDHPGGYLEAHPEQHSDHRFVGFVDEGEIKRQSTYVDHPDGSVTRTFKESTELTYDLPHNCEPI